MKWIRSSFCGESGCLEAMVVDGQVKLRNSNRPDIAPETYGRTGWWVLTSMSFPGSNDVPYLQCSEQEWDAFAAGVMAGEFTYEKLSAAQH